MLFVGGLAGEFFGVGMEGGDAERRALASPGASLRSADGQAHREIGAGGAGGPRTMAVKLLPRPEEKDATFPIFMLGFPAADCAKSPGGGFKVPQKKTCRRGLEPPRAQCSPVPELACLPIPPLRHAFSLYGIFGFVKTGRRGARLRRGLLSRAFVVKLRFLCLPHIHGVKRM